MALKEIKFNKFHLGMPDEQRDLSDGYYYYLENVSVGNDVRQLKQVDNVNSNTNTRSIRAVLSIDGTRYGLGTDATNHLLATIWSNSTSSEGSWTNTNPAGNYNLPSINNPFFVYQGGYIYFLNGLNGGNYELARYTVSGGAMAAFNATITEPLQGGLAWQGNLYGFNATSGNLYKITTAGVATLMITIPSDQTIVKLVDYGNLMAIICTSSVTDSKMYLWDGVTTTTFYDIKSIGRGTVSGGELLPNGVIRVLISYDNLTSLRIKDYDGVGFKTTYFYKGRPNTAGTTQVRVISGVKRFQDFIYFVALVTRSNSSGTWEAVLFRYGKKTEGEPDSFSIYKTLECNSATISGNATADFTIMGGVFVDSIWATVQTNSSYVMTEAFTSLGSFSSQPAVIETGIYTGGDSSIYKSLRNLSLQYAGLTGSGVICYYKADTDTLWTSIFQDTTANSESHEPVNLESTGNNFPTAKEIALRIEINGGNSITGGKFKYEEEHNLYGN